jgi:hypothetical protein
MTLRNWTLGKKALLRIAALGVAGLSLSGCVYDLGAGLYDTGYNNYDCDPYSPWDRYYDCDYGYGFSNIGYGGGWYDNYYYPGYGIFVFDSYGSRYNMRDDYRRYWSNQRYGWYRGQGGGHGRGYGQGGRDHYQNAPRQEIGWPERHGGRIDDRSGRDDHHGRRGGDGHQGPEGAVPSQQPRPDRARPDYPRNEGPGRGNRAPNGDTPNYGQPTPGQTRQPDSTPDNSGYGQRGYGRGGGRNGGNGNGGGGYNRGGNTGAGDNGGSGFTPAPQRQAPAPQAAPEPRFSPPSEPRQERPEPRFSPPSEPRQERTEPRAPREDRPVRVHHPDRVNEE